MIFSKTGLVEAMLQASLFITLLTAMCFMYTRWECAANLQGHNLGVKNTIHLKRVKFTKGRCVRKQNVLVQPV